MRVYAVASGKGGVGKTTTVANLGAALAAGGRGTVVVDADLGMGNLAGVLGVDAGDGPTVHDVLAGRARAVDAVHEGPTGLAVLPASDDLDDFGTAKPENLATLLDDLDGVGAEIVLVDTSAGLSHDSVEPLRVADEVLLVSAPERGALGDTAKTRDVAERFGTPIAGVVITRTTSGTDLDAIADRLGVPIRGSIPDDPAVSAGVEAGEPLVVAAADAAATDAYRRLATELTGDESLAPDGDGIAVAADAPASGDDADEGDSGTTADDADPEAVADESDETERTGFLRWLLR